jgi:long-chain acyl-CoA synthetase
MFSSIHEAFGGNLKKIVCGGAPIRAELGDFFESVGITLVNGYGITECSPLVSVNRDDFNDCSTVGIPLPCCEIKFDNQGEISVKGDIVMLGYYKNPELTAAVMQNGWFKTGDCGYLNEQGQLIINGRKKNLIVLGNGKNIFPEELEGYIQSIPYVKEVIVYGICDKSGLENGLGAELFLSQEALKELNITDAYSALRCDIDKLTAALPRYKHINEIRIRDTEFPKTTTNKIKRDSANLNF